MSARADGRYRLDDFDLVVARAEMRQCKREIRISIGRERDEVPIVERLAAHECREPDRRVAIAFDPRQ